MRRLRWITRTALIRMAVFLVLLAGLGLWGWFVMVHMPGESHHGPLQSLGSEALRAHVEKLAGEIGERNLDRYEGLTAAAAYIEGCWRQYGYEVRRQSYEVYGKTCDNLEVEVAGGSRRAEIVVIGAHYDSVVGSPGANDNGTGVAGLLALSQVFRGTSPARTLRFVAFVNEEPPYFQTDLMGSRVYARRSRERGEAIAAMLSLETIGYYTDAADSQKYPPPFSLFYPSTGNFIGFVGNLRSRALLKEVVASFRRNAEFPSEGAALPEFVPGAGWSDQWSFWQEGYPALMVTDTAPFRYPHYHMRQDTADKVKFDRMALVVAGLEKVIAELASPAPARGD
jgi:hypothetical protein